MNRERMETEHDFFHMIFLLTKILWQKNSFKIFIPFYSSVLARVPFCLRLTQSFSDMPTDLFFNLNFTFSIVASTIGLIFSFCIVFAVVTSVPCRNPTNLLMCNTSIVVSTYFINTLIVSIYGFRDDWAEQQPLCAFRAYCFLMSCGTICYAYLIQAISRLLFTVFYKRKHLHTYRVHWYLIAANWIFGFLFAIEPFFFEGGYRYEKESRLCVFTTQRFATAIYGIIVGFVVPLSISLTIYFIIFLNVTRSSRRIAVIITDTQRGPIFNVKRELRLIRNMVIVMGIFTGGGTPFLILVLWQGIQPLSPPPESLYLLIINAITLFVAAMMMTLFSMNKQVRDVVLRCTRWTGVWNKCNSSWLTDWILFCILYQCTMSSMNHRVTMIYVCFRVLVVMNQTNVSVFASIRVLLPSLVFSLSVLSPSWRNRCNRDQIL